MPGIVGIISQRPAIECEDLVRSMMDTMRHESFYTTATYSCPELGVYGGSVTFEDSIIPGQVFFNERRDIALILSGECILDPQVGVNLVRKGHTLDGGQLGWLVHLYEEEGDQLFANLNGLLSGLLIDRREGKAFLFNDRFGVERIYYHESREATYFASEAKALLRILPQSREFDQEGLAQFLAFGCTVEGRTLFKGVHTLPGSSLWCFENGRCRQGKYFFPETWEAQPTLSPDRFQEAFQETFKQILPAYFESESSVGISLTAGLDTRMIMACRPKLPRSPICYTFSGEKQQTLDATVAAKVASACGLDHRVLRIGSDFFFEFAYYVDKTVYATDGCLGAVGAHEIYMNAQARRLASVRLTGVFGGEIMRGVALFKRLGLQRDLMNPDLSQSVDACARGMYRDERHSVSQAVFRDIPFGRFGTVAAGRSQVRFRSPFLDNRLVALAYRTPTALFRSPSPVLHLVRYNDPVLAAISTDMGLAIDGGGLTGTLRHLYSKATFKLDYLYNEGLPHCLSRLDPFIRQVTSAVGILGLHKFLHYRNWFRGELSSYLKGILSDGQTRRSGLWNAKVMEAVIRDHTGGRKNYVQEINAVLTLEAVRRLLFQDLMANTNPPQRPMVSVVPPANAKESWR